MNKIIVEKEEKIQLTNNVFNLEIKTAKVIIEITGKVLINEIINTKEDNVEIIINLNKNSSLLYNRFLISDKINSNITINQENDSNAIFNYSIIAYNKGKITFNSNIKGDNKNTNIYIRAVTEKKGSLNIACTSAAVKKTKENAILEDIRILLLNDEENIIIPDLLVSSNEVEVNHAATLSGLKQDELFYLMSKGLSREASANLIKNGFLINNLELPTSEQETIKELIGRWKNESWRFSDAQKRNYLSR